MNKKYKSKDLNKQEENTVLQSDIKNTQDQTIEESSSLLADITQSTIVDANTPEQASDLADATNGVETAQEKIANTESKKQAVVENIQQGNNSEIVLNENAKDNSDIKQENTKGEEPAQSEVCNVSNDCKDNNTLIELKNVCKEYDGQNVVDNVNLTIKKGEFVTFLGPSGCGKTTTLRMIAGFEKPTSGEILLDGKSVLDIPPHLRPVNTVFQRYALFPHLNVFDNIAFGLKMKKKELCTDVKGYMARRKAIKKLISEKVKKALKIVGLTDYEYRNVTSLSGGQQQRVAIARAIVNEPQVLLLDEPLGALDLKMRQEMQLELKNMHRRLGITFVYVTHDQEEALTMSDRIVVMKNGIIHQVGTPIDIYNEPSNAFVADFIGESNIINGIMLEDKLVRFAGTEFVCVDSGFEKNQAIDVVIRPEDIFLMDEEKGQIKGEVISSLFKGVHYEMSVIANKVEFLIHSTSEWKAGEKVSLYIRPNDIHIMKKEKNTNVINAKILNESEIEFADGVFNFDKNTFEKAGFAENEYLKEEVKISIDFDKIELTDYEDSAPIAGNIVSSIFKGDKYQYVVKSDNGFDFFVDTIDEYDSNDRVGISIKPQDIKLVKILQSK